MNFEESFKYFLFTHLAERGYNFDNFYISINYKHLTKSCGNKLLKKYMYMNK